VSASRAGLELKRGSGETLVSPVEESLENRMVFKEELATM